jgi:hypothetical protein
MSDFLQRDVGSTERGAPRDLRLHDYEKFGMNNETFMRGEKVPFLQGQMQKM